MLQFFKKGMSCYYSQPHICQCLSRLSTARANSAATISGSRRKTGKQFVEAVVNLAAGLIQLGVGVGDTVAICAFNSDLYLEWLLGIAFVGGIVAPLNYRWSFQEAKSAIFSVRPVMLVTDESCSCWYSQLQTNDIPSVKWNVFLGSSSSHFMNKSNFFSDEAIRKHAVTSSAVPFNYSWAPEGAVLICFTSGTTGRPKGVTISHGALIVQSLAKVAIVGYSDDDVYLHTAPLCHIGGLSSALAMLMVGACHVLISKFEATLAVDFIEQHHVTSLITVPAIMSDLIPLTRVRETWKGSQSVTKILNGGGSLSPELVKDAAKSFPRAKLLSAYGMTETCSSLTFRTLYDPTLGSSFCKMKSGSLQQPQGVCVGKPAPHVELMICSKDPSRKIGRILTRGPHVMLRYWDQNPTTSDVKEAWLDTGDIGSMDEHGNVWLVGRMNGRIKSGGENVYPEEVEAILSKHPGVSGVVTVGIPDVRLTEMVVACIKLKEGWQWMDNICSEALQKFCREKNLTGFKVPKHFVLWEKKPFPLTTTGKVRRDQVQREVVSYLHSFPSNL